MSDEVTIDSAEIRKQLASGVCQIEFFKLNGDQRKMRCTTNESVLRELNAIKSDSISEIYEPQDGYTRVFDIELNAWRSFCNENLISIEKEQA